MMCRINPRSKPTPIKCGRWLTWAGFAAVGLHPSEHLAGRYDSVPGFDAPGVGSTIGVVGVVNGVLVVRQHVHDLVIPNHLREQARQPG